jgi:hypothetical protein
MPEAITIAARKAAIQRRRGCNLLEATAETVVHDDWQLALWGVYSSRLGEAQRKSPFRQHMGKDEFLACLRDETFIKFILRQDAAPIGILLLARDISRVSWLHTAFFEAQYPAAYEARQLFYYAGIAISSGVSPKGAVMLHSLMLSEFFRLRGKILFHDYAANVHASSGSLGQFMTRKYGGTATEVDQMHFWCLQSPDCEKPVSVRKCDSRATANAPTETTPTASRSSLA